MTRLILLVENNKQILRGNGSGSAIKNPDGGTPLASAPGAEAASGLTMKLTDNAAFLLDYKTPLGYAVASGVPFVDVARTARYYGNVAFTCAHGLFAGTDADKFSPNASMTRGMIVTVLGKLAGADASKYTAISFSDVPIVQYCAAFADWAKENGIASGAGGGKFSPDSNAAREDLAVIIYNYARFMDIDLPEKKERLPFADNGDISGYAEEALCTIAGGWNHQWQARRHGRLAGTRSCRYAPAFHRGDSGIGISGNTAAKWRNAMHGFIKSALHGVFCSCRVYALF
ncbi:MAG: S-layer homology domain-containing protein [Clostridiales bacterium]|jgi:hypothetical protein|nr:S-layer homology domain-containing protein [Clostridiales bacterium]